MHVKREQRFEIRCSIVGKTISFMLPALIHIAAQRRVKPGEGPIVCPCAAIIMNDNSNNNNIKNDSNNNNNEVMV